jgi:hypothetical protein
MGFRKSGHPYIKVKIFLQKSGCPFIKGIFFFKKSGRPYIKGIPKKAVTLLLVGFQKSGLARFYHS